MVCFALSQNLIESDHCSRNFKRISINLTKTKGNTKINNRFGIGQKKSKAFQKCSKCNYCFFILYSCICFHWGKQVFDQGVYSSIGTYSTAYIGSNAPTQNKMCTWRERKKKLTHTHIYKWRVHYISSFSIFEALLLKLVLYHAKATKILPIPYSNIDRHTWHIASDKKKWGESKRKDKKSTAHQQIPKYKNGARKKKQRIEYIYILATWSNRNRDTCEIPLSCWWIFFS